MLLAVFAQPLLLPTYGRPVPNTNPLAAAGPRAAAPAESCRFCRRRCWSCATSSSRNFSRTRRSRRSRPSRRSRTSRREHEEFQEEFDRLAKLDEEWRDYMSQSQSYSGRSAEDEERRQFFFDSLVGQRDAPAAPARAGAAAAISTADDRKLAELIIGNIDDAGFLTVDARGNRAATPAWNSPTSSACSSSCRPFIPSASARATCASACSSSSSASARSRASNTASSIGIIEDLGKRRFPEIARRLGTTRRAGAARRQFHRHARPEAGPDFHPRSEQLRPARRDRGKDRRRLADLAQRRADPAPAHQQHLQGSDVAGRTTAPT